MIFYIITLKWINILMALQFWYNLYKGIYLPSEYVHLLEEAKSNKNMPVILLIKR